MTEPDAVTKFHIDDITWNDLDMDEVYDRINTCRTSAGDDYLKNILRNIPLTASKDDLGELTDRLDKEKALKDKIIKPLNAAGKANRIDFPDMVVKLENAGVESNLKHYLTGLFVILSFLLIFISPGWGFIAFILMFAIAIMTYFSSRRVISKELETFVYIIALIKCAGKLTGLGVTDDVFLFDELKALYEKHKSFARGSFIIPKGVHTGGNPVDLILDYVRMTFHLDIIKYNSMLSRVKREGRDIMRLHDIIGRLDTAVCLVDYRNSLDVWCRPKFCEKDVLKAEITEGYHPLIDEPVTNPAELHKGMLVTGSNASGKSTYLKMTALNIIMAQALNLCCAKSYTAPYLRLYTSMAVKDSILKGESYYIAEIKSLKRILDAASDSFPMVCVIDEVLRGTNTVERIAASYEIIKSLIRPNVIEIVATHDIELTGMLKGLDNYHFREEIEDDDVRFDYKLYKGPATSRDAIKLLKVIGFEDNIVSRAEDKAEEFINTGIWKA